ncbi:uncharacterized protein UTRI_00097 [Ustilago trichophora]|uniref:Zn(2)-C6 fungal-type domain-containing protein n=1 Tax=Ustilago trichophora TaxID=86804 RepID=A0A5C3DTV6_9BASI|nr:uncharacterized protein UTRI_00097 [Ustilago trichophora]
MPDDSETITTATHDDGQPAKRKRLRIPKSCIPCLKGKRACDRGRPACGRCARSGQSTDCSYDPRLPQQPASASSKNSRVYDDSDDDDDASAKDTTQLAALHKELQEARNETRRLQQLLRSHNMPAPASPHSYSPSHYRGSHASTSADRYRSHSTSHDLHAARGLQMLAEIAGPQHQDADSNAVKSRILHWSGPGSHASSSSQPSPSHQSASSSHDSSRPKHPSVSHTSSPVDRYLHSTGASSVYKNFQRPNANTHDTHNHVDHLDSPKNINGTHMYYGDSTSNDGVLRKVAAGTASSSHHNAANVSASIHETMARRDMQSAFNSVLDPSRDTFPFATIWSSGTAFIDEVLPFFPRPEDFDSICASFVRHFSAMCPALTIPTAIDHAKTFSRMPRKQQAQVSLPWLAVFLMICALGKNCDLESTTVGVDRKVRMLDAFLAGEASQQPSRQGSRASSPSPGETAAATEAQQPSSSSTRSPAMVSDLFLSAAYQSLRLCSFLSAPTLQTIHSQLLIGAYLLNTERAASFWPLLGSVARQAQSIGLHLDPYKIKRDWDPVEADTRRRLWWAVVHQDVILSSIFGRPLGITRFSCRFPGTTLANPSGATTYATLQCEFSQFARIYLDENQDRSWSQAKIIDFTDKVLQWYMHIPDRYRPDLGPIDLLGSEDESEAIQNYHAAGVDIKTKGLMEVHQSGNLAVEVFYILLSLHRSNLFPSADTDADSAGKNSDTPQKSGELNQVSLHICAQALRRITRAQQTMIDLLGRARATMFWKIAYYTYQAAIAGAYIVFVHPQSKHAESALQDLAILTDFFDRMPEKWTGLKMAKHGLRVLRKLAVAARETPEAASMALRQEGGMGAASSPVGFGGGLDASSVLQDGVGIGGGQGETGQGGSSTPSSHLLGGPPIGVGESSSNVFNSQSAFLPPIFNSSFLSPSAATSSAAMMGTNPTLLSSHPPPPPTSSYSTSLSSGATLSSSSNFTEPSSIFAGAIAAAAASSSSCSNSPVLSRSLASVPLVTLFNNTYDAQQDHVASSSSSSHVPMKQSFCYDPFIPDPTTTSSNNYTSVGGNTIGEGGSSASPTTTASNLEQRTTKSSISSPGTSFSSSITTHNSVATTASEDLTKEKNSNINNTFSTPTPAASTNSTAHIPTSPTPLNQKDLANYWSEYFSLQLDWDRLTGLA